MPTSENLLFNRIKDEVNAATSDRAVAVVGGSIVEASLRDLLHHALVSSRDVSDYIDRATIGPLRKVAFGIGLLPLDLYQELKLIADVRDHLAHRYEQKSFDEHPMADAIDKLIAPARFGEIQGEPVRLPDGRLATTVAQLPRRWRFIAAVAAASTTIQGIQETATKTSVSVATYLGRSST